MTVIWARLRDFLHFNYYLLWIIIQLLFALNKLIWFKSFQNERKTEPKTVLFYLLTTDYNRRNPTSSKSAKSVYLWLTRSHHCKIYCICIYEQLEGTLLSLKFTEGPQEKKIQEQSWCDFYRLLIHTLGWMCTVYVYNSATFCSAYCLKLQQRTVSVSNRIDWIDTWTRRETCIGGISDINISLGKTVCETSLLVTDGQLDECLQCQQRSTSRKWTRIWCSFMPSV